MTPAATISVSPLKSYDKCLIQQNMPTNHSPTVDVFVPHERPSIVFHITQAAPSHTLTRSNTDAPRFEKLGTEVTVRGLFLDGPDPMFLINPAVQSLANSNSSPGEYAEPGSEGLCDHRDMTEAQ